MKTEQPEDRQADRRRLGLRVRELRRARSLTTRELAERAGVSASLVSLIETERSGASITTLRRMAMALDVPVVEFLSDPGTGTGGVPDDEGGPVATVVRRSERRRLSTPDEHGLIELLSPDTKRQVEFLWFELSPEHELSEGMMAHPGEEHALVLAGTMHLYIGDEVHVLEVGDSIVFDSSVPHRVENHGTERLVQVSAITPPRY